MEREPRILLYDLEVTRQIVEGYGNKWEFKVVKTVRHQQLMSFAWKWRGDKKVSYLSRHDFSTYKDFVFALWELLDEADVAIAHNASGFDNKMSNRFFVEQGFVPPAPYRTIDTLLVARREFKFPGNSLDELTEFLGLTRKEKITYADLETDFMSDKPARKTLKLMEKYNKGDIISLEEVYERFLPYIRNHPNMAIMSGRPNVCTRCGGTNFQSRGTTDTNSATYRIFRCTTCGGTVRHRLQDKVPGQLKSVYVNV